MFVFFLLSAAVLGGVAGVTAGKLLLKTSNTIATVGGLFPNGVDPIPDVPDPNNPGKLKIQWVKVISAAVMMAVGYLVVKWVGKKLKIKFLK